MLLHASPFFNRDAKETTDCSNQEQVTVIIHGVTQNLEVHEKFLGLYQVGLIDAVTLTAAIKDTLNQAEC